MKLFLYLLVVLFCTGCASMEFTHNGKGKFYITSESFPTVTNDKSFGKNDQKTQRIVIDKKIEYQYIYRF